jgi:glycosyltransferase involved in cell wall biosynthesis
MDLKPLLTLAVIVKDESKLLEGVLDHHRDLYDEAIVVDTGSRDQSREMALKSGARLFDFEWNDDFSAARNHGLKQARGRWVLQLDCDERIDPIDFSSLLETVRQPPDHGLALTVNNYTRNSMGVDWNEVQPADLPWCLGAPGYLRTYPIRLFPRHQELRYRGVIHENLQEDLQLLDLPQKKSPIVIHHTGLLDEQGLARRKTLYERLLKKKVSQNPQDLQGVTEYGRFLLGQGQLSLAAKLLEKGLELEESQGQHAQANLLMVEIHARLGKLNLAIDRLLPTIRQHPDQLLCWVQAGALFLASGEKQKAAIYLEQGQKLFPLSPSLKQLQAKV